MPAGSKPVSAGPNSTVCAQTLPPPPPLSGAPAAVSARNTSTLRAINALVTIGTEEPDRTVLTFVRCLAHSGHRMPTDVGVIQSVQIGRPHDEHETPVSRDGWR